jgi:hypothetical protein
LLGLAEKTPEDLSLLGRLKFVIAAKFMSDSLKVYLTGKEGQIRMSR